MNNETSTPKFKKVASGEYAAEFTYNGQECRVTIEAQYPGWAWSAYINGQYVQGDGGQGFRLKPSSETGITIFVAFGFHLWSSWVGGLPGT